MVLHHHGHGDEPEDEVASARNARLGMKLFVLYLALYIGYVLLTAFRPDVMRTVLPGGVNLAIAYGFGLIVAALLMAFLYGWLCRFIAPEKSAEKAGRE